MMEKRPDLQHVLKLNKVDVELLSGSHILFHMRKPGSVEFCSRTVQVNN